MNLDTFFQHLWQDYVQLAPQADRLHRLFAQRGEAIVNDHVAFRTFNQSPIHLAALEPHLLALGYRRFEAYDFPAKKLFAWSYVAPDPVWPRVFVSELDWAALSPIAQTIIQSLCAQIDSSKVEAIDIFWAGRLWNPISWEDYQILQAESEYAAWMAAHGLRPNHFTLSVNHLCHSPTLEAVVQLVAEQGIPLNEAGGMIKGSPGVLLEQASTLADRLPVSFAHHKVQVIPTCYYEFARRYPLPDGSLYQGFVAASADRIFESTHRQN